MIEKTEPNDLASTLASYTCLIVAVPNLGDKSSTRLPIKIVEQRLNNSNLSCTCNHSAEARYSFGKFAAKATESRTSSMIHVKLKYATF